MPELVYFIVDVAFLSVDLRDKEAARAAFEPLTDNLVKPVQGTGRKS